MRAQTSTSLTVQEREILDRLELAMMEPDIVIQGYGDSIQIAHSHRAQARTRVAHREVFKIRELIALARRARHE